MSAAALIFAANCPPVRSRQLPRMPFGQRDRRGSRPMGDLSRRCITPSPELNPCQRAPQGSLCNALHNPPYEHGWVMRSVVVLVLVTATRGLEHCA
jgi:hypothetical protein